MAGVGQTISKLGIIFEKYVSHSMPIFEKKSHPIRPVEGFKLCLDFLCNACPYYIEKSKQSFKPSTGRIGRDFFRKLA